MSPKVTDLHKEERRREILQAAKRVFQQKGFEPTTMKDIVEESGMSRGGVYMYFSSTEEIFQALFALLDEERSRYLQDLVETSETAWGAIEAFLRSVEQDIMHVRESFAPAVFEYLMTGWRKAERRPYLGERYDQAIRIYTQLLQKGVERGEFDPLLPLSAIAGTLASMLDGLSLVSLYVGHEKLGLDNQIKAIIFFLKHSLQIPEREEHE